MRAYGSIDPETSAMSTIRRGLVVRRRRSRCTGSPPVRCDRRRVERTSIVPADRCRRVRRPRRRGGTSGSCSTKRCSRASSSAVRVENSRSFRRSTSLTAARAAALPESLSSLTAPGVALVPCLPALPCIPGSRTEGGESAPGASVEPESSSRCSSPPVCERSINPRKI